MPTLPVMPNPFVKWNFKCEDSTDERQKKRRIRNYLESYLLGYATALKIAGVGTFRYVFKDDFSPKRNGSKDFIYTAKVERKSRKVPSPDATVNPTSPPQPNP